MLCDRKNIPEFTKKQIAECQKCKFASGKKIWCCLFGVWIGEQKRIMVPSKKILQPKYPGIFIMIKNFGKSAFNHARGGFKKRSKEEQEKIRQICETSGPGGKKCNFYIPDSLLGPRCTKCGCCMNLKKRWATSHCPIGLW